ncbi:MAG: hypothetical protein P8Y70_00605 [Candidatus Lokiarchaeota archaeon]
MLEYKKHLMICFLLFVLFVPIVSSIFPMVQKNNSYEMNTTNQGNPSISDIAGDDLYAEMIEAYVSGPYSIIRNSLLTNDTNLLSNFDINDPAFQGCSLLLSSSNLITPSIFPQVLTNYGKDLEITPIKNGFAGFLYYNDKLSVTNAKIKADRAFEIIQEKFKIDLIRINSSIQNFFPFIGYEPNWEIYLPELLENIPKDGYWKSFDLERITNMDYYNNKHLSSYLLILNSLNFIKESKNFSTAQFNFDLNKYDLSILENNQLQNVFNQMINNLANFQIGGNNLSLFLDSSSTNQTSSQNELNQFNQILGDFSLSNETRYTLLTIQYEGLDEGIEKLEENKYSFDLFKALGFSEELKPSEKVYISLVGAFLSGIDINILCSNIISTNEKYFKFSDYLLEQIGLILFLADVDFNINALKNYTFEIFWENNEGLKASRLDIKNLNDKYDTINLIEVLGFTGIPFLPTGLLNPIHEFQVIYNVSASEPQLQIYNHLIDKNASYGIFHDFSTKVTVKNVGKTKAWGIPTDIPLDLNDIVNSLPGIISDLTQNLLDSMWDVIEEDYSGEYSSIEDFFNLDETPKIFYFQTIEENSSLKYFPDLTNFSNLSPYNKDADYVINKVAIRNPQLIFDLNQLGITNSMLKDFFTNKYSIWNKENWYINSGEEISLPNLNVSISDFDSFSNFYSYNFTIKDSYPKLPALVSGISFSNTTSSMALEKDNSFWIIDSEQKYIDQHEVEVQFLFENTTNLDLENKTLDKVSINIDFKEIPEISNLSFQIYNYSLKEFKEVNSYIESSENNTIKISFIKNKNQIGWIFDKNNPNAHRIVFKIIGIHDESFNISLDNVDIQFWERDINEFKMPRIKLRYGNLEGKIHYSIISNSIHLSTFSMASLLVKANLTENNCKVGQKSTYFLTMKNIGSESALNVSINFRIPGIIENLNDFALIDSNLTYFLPKLKPNEKKIVNFSFYIPNSGKIFSPIIRYNNPKGLGGENDTDLKIESNDVSYYAPVNYENLKPFVRSVEIYYNESKSKVNDEILLNVKNVGIQNTTIPEVIVKLEKSYGDLKILNNTEIVIQNLSINEVKNQNLPILIIDWKSYFLPSVSDIMGNESRTIQILKTKPLILGNISLKILKWVNKEEVEVGENVLVSIKVENTGTLCIKDLQLRDIISFSQNDFSLVGGNLVFNIKCLNPGEDIVFNYTINAKRQVYSKLEPATLKYFFLYEYKALSNDIMIKIMIPQSYQTFYVLIPSFLGLIILSTYVWKVKLYHAKNLEVKRKEISILNLTTEDSIIKINYSLQERLKGLFGDNSNNQSDKTIKEGEEL